MQPETDFEHEMRIAREVMAEDFNILRAFADLDRTGSCTLDGKTYTEADLHALSAKRRAERSRK